jgi:hypothetical protein
MKKALLLIFTLSTCFSFAQKEKGTVTLIDGTILNGYVSVSNKIKFRSSLEEKSTTYDYESAKEATVVDKKGKESKFEYVVIKENKKPIILEILVDGFLRLYTENTTQYTSSFGGGGMGGFRSSSTYYLKKQTEEIAQQCAAFGYIGNSFKKFINSYFTDCPEIITKVEKKEFKKKNYDEIVEFYNSNCATKE